jgi:flavin-binding protein dodecin
MGSGLNHLTVSQFNIVPGCRRVKSLGMSDHVYKKIELVGSSPKSIEAAVENALARAKKTIRNMRWLEVTETRGHIQGGKIDHWQVAVKVGFTLED